VTWLLQAIILLLDLTPLKSVFSRIYDLGVRRVVAALSSHPGVSCILGSGSYFEKRPTFGLSDVDLIIVLNESVTRADACAREIAHIYQRQQYIFRFLGAWQEKEANLIYLSDIAVGFPAPESFRVRYKQGRLVALYGELPEGIVSGGITRTEVLGEIDTLLRFSLVADPRHVRRQIFWKRIFTKLAGLADLIDLPDLANAMRKRMDLRFADDDDTLVFFRASDPDAMFSLQLALSREIMDQISAREPKQKIRQARFPSDAVSEEPVPLSFAREIETDQLIDQRSIPSVPIGFGPRMLYFPIGNRIPILELHAAPYDGILRLRKLIGRRPPSDENALVSADGFLFVISRQPTFVDLIPLDPLQFANVYAAAFGDGLQFETSATVLAEQQAGANQMFHALANLYRIHDGRVTKLPHPCIYREDEGEVIENALRILRAHAACWPQATLIQRTPDLFEYLRRKHPQCADFLGELERYQRCMYGDFSLGRTEANNIYHCLHQFMYQELAGVEPVEVDSPYAHLGITVGVITRNRAGDLAEMLESLTRQVRPPDEVLVVDNGSTDRTKEVLERFRECLPIQYKFLERADIPAARNMVIESAANEIISFIDDDCISEPQWLAAIERGFLRAENVGVVGGWVHHQPAAHRSTVDNYYRIFHHIKS
jgi:hypothetical protein